MSPVALSALLALLAVSVRAQDPTASATASSAAPPSTITATPTPTTAPAPGGGLATYPAVPLAERRFEYGNLPYKVDTENLIRGTQVGYNICNSTTEGPESLCQTSFINSIDDFCLWGPPEPNSTIGDTEGEAVAWCSKPGRGTRLIPEGTLQGVQFMRTPDYIQVVGFIEQTNLNIQEGDYGGELDPHGADLRGNPLGGLLFSNAWSGGGDNFQQVIEWHNFIGGNFFCLKACDPAGPNAARFCEHIFDRIGCAYNAPNNAQNGTFESCLGENQDFPGIYTENGQVVTYTQPAESLGPISTMPYQPKVPASSSCTPFTSSELYTGLPTASGASATATGSGVSTSRASATGSRSGTAAGAGSTSSASGASNLAIPLFSLVGAVAAAALLA